MAVTMFVYLILGEWRVFPEGQSQEQRAGEDPILRQGRTLSLKKRFAQSSARSLSLQVRGTQGRSRGLLVGWQHREGALVWVR